MVLFPCRANGWLLMKSDFVSILSAGNNALPHAIRHLQARPHIHEQAPRRDNPRQDSRHLPGRVPPSADHPHRPARRLHPHPAHQVPGHTEQGAGPHRPDAGDPRRPVALRAGGLGRGRGGGPYPRPDAGADLPARPVHLRRAGAGRETAADPPRVRCRAELPRGLPRTAGT